jgi:cation:H+ antiporter
MLFCLVGSAAAVALGGLRLARHGDAIAARTRLGGLWIGSVFVAVATSLPELASDTSAVLLGAPDLGVGGLFGSNISNMLTLAIVSLVPGRDLFRRAALDNGLAASLAMTLTGSAAALVLVRPTGSLLGVGVGPLLLAVGYVAGVRTLFRNSELARTATRVEETGEEPLRADGAPSRHKEELRRAIRGFVLASATILIAAPVFASSANALAEATGLAKSFVGTLLVAVATTMPELVTSLAAVRLRAYDLAVGNLFGSNAFNMSLFLALDLAAPGSIFAHVSPVHALSGLVALVLMGIGLAAIVYRAEGRLAALEPSAALMIVVYVLGMGLVYLQSGG